MSTDRTGARRILLTDHTVSARLGVAAAIAAQPGLRSMVVDVASEAIVGLQPDLEPFLGEAEVLVTAYSPIDERVLSAAPRLRLIVKAGIGTETIDTDAAERHGVIVTCTPGTNIHSVVEYTLGAMLMSLRDYIRLDSDVRRGRWREARATFAGELRELRDCRLGIIGLGGIGSELARAAAALGMDVVACDPVRDLPPRPLDGVATVELETLLKTADFVSLNAILTASTVSMIGEREFGLMKPTAIFINAARGGLVDSEALSRALELGRLAGAFIDVQEIEPPKPEHPLLRRADVILTPHLGGSTRRGYDSIGIEVAHQIATFISGAPLDPGVVVVDGSDRRRAHEGE